MVELQLPLLLRSVDMRKVLTCQTKSVALVNALVGFLVVSLLPQCSICAPIQTPDFSTCTQASYPNSGPNGTARSVSCCPPVTNTPPIQFTPPPAPATLRVRPAVQCANSTYLWQLNRAYSLMRALPDSDPRSLLQQSNIHCAYCGGAFLQSGSTSSNEAIDIHYSWLFFPWHRMFLHFHERILQSLLNDPSFSLPFWNWDNQGSPSPSSASCQQAGNLFPQTYNDQYSTLYDANRNPQHAAASNSVIDLAFVSSQANGTIWTSSSALEASNLNVMHRVMVGAGTTAETFLGSVYRAGDSRPRSGVWWQEASGGTLEMGPHVSTHFWVAQDYAPYLDLGAPWVSAFDPVFYAHHANVDRLWNMWNSQLGRANFNDPDWLDAEFLFYDENAQLVQVKVSDALDMSSLGYEYETVDNSWAYYTASRCGTVNARDMVEQFRLIPQRQRSTGERITLSNGGTFHAILTRTPSKSDVEGNDSEEMLVIHGIHFDPADIVSFDVFLNLPEAGSGTPQSCAEYLGRFHHLPLLQPGNKKRTHRRQFKWQISVTNTLRDLRMDMLPSMLVTLVSSSPSSRTNASILSFRSISVERQQRQK
ncbi:unnamed protein product [Calypogeia fissa]